MNLLECIVFGLISGLSEFLPISSDAHGILLGRLFGTADVGSGMRLAVHLGMLFSLFLACSPQISKISRERRIAAIPLKRRKRKPDAVCLMDWRILKTAAIAIVLGFVAYPWVWDQGLRLWILGIGLIASGIMLYIPQFFPGATKDATNVSPMDAIIIGLAGAFGVLPGISRMGAVLSVSQMRGCDRSYCLHLALLLSLPALVLLCLLDIAGLIATGISGISFLSVLGAALAAVTAAGGSYLGIYLMRFLSVKAGYSAFAFYNWGAALFAFILYLAI